MESKNGIHIRIMRVEDYVKLKSFMGGYFYKEEPFGCCVEESVHDFYDKKHDDYHISMIAQGTCLLAINENEGDQIVGMVLAEGHVPSDLERRHKEANSLADDIWRRTEIFISKIERKLDLFERYGISSLLYSHLTYVHASMRGKGLGSRLAAALMELGRIKGFPLMVAYCTSYYSSKQKMALGMECVYELAYTENKNDVGEVEFMPPAPHTHYRVMVIKLSPISQLIPVNQLCSWQRQKQQLQVSCGRAAL